MDATTLSGGTAGELADLQRRAYGPRADDPLSGAEWARLGELQARARQGRPSAVVETAPAVDDADLPPAPEPEVTAEQGAPVESAPSEPTADAAEPAAPAPTPRSWRTVFRRPPRWLIAVAALATGIVVGVAGAQLTAPRPDAILSVTTTPGIRGETWEQDMFSWGLDPSAVVPLEEFEGASLWIVSADDGADCLVMSSLGTLLTLSCSRTSRGPEIAWTVDRNSTIPGLFESLAPGTDLRFVLRGSTAEVWVYPAEGAQAIDTSWRASSAIAP